MITSGSWRQDRAQPADESEIFNGVDLHLGQAVDLVFDRVLQRDDVAFAVGDGRQRVVERGGFARTRRSGDQNQPVRALDVIDHLLERAVAHADLVERAEHLVAVKQAQRGRFAAGGWAGVQADIDVFFMDADLETAVLRFAPFR